MNNYTPTPTPAEQKLIESYAPLIEQITRPMDDAREDAEFNKFAHPVREIIAERDALKSDNARLRCELLAIANTCEHFKNLPGLVSIAQAARKALGL